MKPLFSDKARAFLVIGVATLLFITPVLAGQGINITPGTIVLNSTQPSIESRTLTLVAEENVTSLQIIPLDLTTGDGRGVIPESSISVMSYEPQMVNGSIQKVPLKFLLSPGSSGFYSGELWIFSSNSGIIKIPVSATVKDDPWLAIFCLVVGVFVSYMVFTYGSRYKPLDEIRRTLAVLEEALSNDKDLKKKYLYDSLGTTEQNPFGKKIEDDIETAHFKLDLQKTEDGEFLSKSAESTLDLWKKNKWKLVPFLEGFADLIETINNIEKTLKEKNIGTKSSLLRDIRQDLQKKFNAQVTDIEQKDFGNAVTSHTEECNSFSQAILDLRECEKLCADPGTGDSDSCKKVQEFWGSLAAVAKPEDLVPIRQKISELLKSLRSSAVGKNRGEYRADGFTPAIRILPQVASPGSVSGEIREEGLYAKIRLFLYTWAVFLIAVITLTGYGFYQFYLTNPTFGATPGDYCFILLWGFLAGSTADSLTSKAKTLVGIS